LLCVEAVALLGKLPVLDKGRLIAPKHLEVLIQRYDPACMGRR
jgi:hypothetical protein